MQAHLQKLDIAMLDLYAHQKKTLVDYADLKLDNDARNTTLQAKDITIKDYAAYQEVLSYGIIDMADHLRWTVAGTKGKSAIRRPELVQGEPWQPRKKQILDLVIQFEGELAKVSTQRTLNIAYTAEITKLKAPPTLTPLTPGGVINPILQADIDKLTAELRSQQMRMWSLKKK